LGVGSGRLFWVATELWQAAAGTPLGPRTAQIRDGQPVRRLPARRPGKILFGRDDRRISHGCIRVQNVRELAALLLQQPIDTVNQAIATGGTTRTDLPAPVPVFVVYETAFADINGTLQFRPDIYNRDAEIWSYLNPLRQPIAERDPPPQPHG
jgi:hypothetical protein